MKMAIVTHWDSPVGCGWHYLFDGRFQPEPSIYGTNIPRLSWTLVNTIFVAGNSSSTSSFTCIRSYAQVYVIAVHDAFFTIHAPALYAANPAFGCARPRHMQVTNATGRICLSTKDSKHLTKGGGRCLELWAIPANLFLHEQFVRQSCLRKQGNSHLLMSSKSDLPSLTKILYNTK